MITHGKGGSEEEVKPGDLPKSLHPYTPYEDRKDVNNRELVYILNMLF